jgi:thiosulfate/3-mercaptopyruvate sulfurtransferase
MPFTTSDNACPSLLDTWAEFEEEILDGRSFPDGGTNAVKRGMVAVLAVALIAGFGVAARSQGMALSGTSTALAATSSVDPVGQGGAGEPWRADQLVEPGKLAKELASSSGKTPMVLYVGYPLLYAGGHIPEARYVGPASTAAGLQALREAAQELPRDADIVLYCGCCPMDRCPNIRPAFRLLEHLGFTNVKVLDIPVNFPHDWTSKGLPVEKGNPVP